MQACTCSWASIFWTARTVSTRSSRRPVSLHSQLELSNSSNISMRHQKRKDETCDTSLMLDAGMCMNCTAQTRHRGCLRNSTQDMLQGAKR